MTTVREDLSGDLDDTLFDDEGLAEEVTYDSSAITAHVVFQEEWDEEKGGNINVCHLQVKTADVASPAYRDPVIVGSETWYMDHIISGDGLSWILYLKQEERPKL